MSKHEQSAPMCECFWTDPSTWLSAASCGYGSGYEPGSQREWNPGCPAHRRSVVADENSRILRHEIETPMRCHDEDGTCCRNARFGITSSAADVEADQ